MDKKESPCPPFKYRGKLYTPIRKLRIRGKLFFIVEEWSTRYKAFDTSANQWRSIRVRSAHVKYEMRLMQFAKMRNSSVPYTFEHFKDEQNEYLVQEWVDGYDLRYYLRREAAGTSFIDAERAYHLIRGLVYGLNKLHERGVIHGDIKPENLIVADTKRLTMIDFGAAWTGARTKLRPDQKTRGYASPEQWQRERLVDHRTDQFSTSVVFYEMLTGELPYDGWGGFGSDYTNHPPLIPPSKKNREVWSSLDGVIMRGLSLDRNRRYETSAAWLQAMNDAMPTWERLHDPFSAYLPGIDLWQNLKTGIATIRSRFQ
jgi:serine/threonine protein kinase